MEDNRAEGGVFQNELAKSVVSLLDKVRGD